VSSLTAVLLLALSPAFAMENSGAHCGVTELSHRVVEDAAGWEQLWKELGKPAPKLDLKKEFAVAVFAGTRPSTAYKVVIDAPKAEKDALVVRYAVLKPKGMAGMMMTTPYAVRTFARAAGKTVKVEERKP
jgi:hypothetical protein